jgi:hypothetical protein
MPAQPTYAETMDNAYEEARLELPDTSRIDPPELVLGVPPDIFALVNRM